MLNIFLGRKSSPQYRLVAPPNGELQTITVHKQVWEMCDGESLARAEARLDFENTAIRLWGGLTKYQVHPGTIRVLHCPTGQTSPESCPPADVGSDRDARSGYTKRTIYL